LLASALVNEERLTNQTSTKATTIAIPGGAVADGITSD